MIVLLLGVIVLLLLGSALATGVGAILGFASCKTPEQEMRQAARKKARRDALIRCYLRIFERSRA